LPIAIQHAERLPKETPRRKIRLGQFLGSETRDQPIYFAQTNGHRIAAMKNAVVRER
jgi:hypothetical protein